MHWRRPLVVDTALALTWGTMGLDEDCRGPVRPGNMAPPPVPEGG